MVKKSFLRLTIREIKSSFSRFLAIFAIVALGVGFLAGLLATTPDMQYSVQVLYEQTGFMDLHILSNLGMTQNDADAISNVDGIGFVMPAHSEDAEVTSSATGSVLVARIHGVESSCWNTDNFLNRLVLEEGRFPQSDSECVVEREIGGSESLKIGSILYLSDDAENLSCRELEIVGTVTSGYYISGVQRGVTSIGSGKIQTILYICDENFTQDYYTEIYATVEGVADLPVFSDEYEELVSQVKDRIEALSETQKYVRSDELREDAQSELDKAKKEFEDARTDGQKELDDALIELEDGQKELDDALIELEDGQRELDDALAKLQDGEKEYADGIEEFENGKKELDDAKADGLQEIEDGQKELDDAERKLNDALAELQNGEKEFEDGKKELDDALTELQDGQQEFDDAVISVQEAQIQIDDGFDLISDGFDQIYDAEKQINDGFLLYYSSLETYNQNLSVINAAQAQIDSSDAELSAAEAEYASAMDFISALYSLENLQEVQETLGLYLASNAARVNELNDLYVSGAELSQSELLELSAYGDMNSLCSKSDLSMQEFFTVLDSYSYALNSIGAVLDENRQALDEAAAELDGNRQILNAGKQQLDATYIYLTEQQTALSEGRKELHETQQELLIAERELKDGLAEIEENRQKLEDGWAEYYNGQKKLEDARRELDDGWAEYYDGLQEYSDGVEELENGKKEFDDKIAEAQAEIDNAEKELEDARRELDDGWTEYYDGLKKLDDGWVEYYDGKKELEEGWAEYNDGLAEFDDKIEEAQDKLNDAQDEIDSIEQPEWYILDRDTNPAYVSYESDTQKVAAIAKVFPVFFFLVAALVASTTMTRLIDESRGLTGVLKALGYSNAFIAGRYFLYAGIAGIFGCIFGLSVGLKLFPLVICNAYKIMYNLPELVASDHLSFALISSSLIIAAIFFATFGALRSSLYDCASELMRPKAPPAGKRIFLERIGFIWKRMKFTHKVTARNLLRYKKRFFMTVIGIAGCTALLLTGFGLRDSISDIIDIQYGELINYNLTLTLKHEGDELSDRRIRNVLQDPERIFDYTDVFLETCTASANGQETSLSVVVTNDVDMFTDFVTFRQRISGERVSFDENSAILSEKAASKLGLKIGDSFILKDSDDDEAEITLSGICENYVQGYIYLPYTVYRDAFGKDCEFTTILAKANDPDDETRDAIASALLISPNASSVQFSTTIKDTFSDMLASIDYIVIVLIISAGLLAFVVLYNLTNINIAEREKEIATIKVLGFRRNEVSSYIFRETIILSIIGTLVGLAAGIFLHAFVVRTAEVDAVMFGRVIKVHSYFYSAIMSSLFTLIVSFAMSFKLRAIDMVESLKSPE